jgi:hypothetical protein
MKRKAAVVIGALLLAMLLAPVGFATTVLLFPVWRFAEQQFGMESIGHSGPAEWCFLLVYSLTLAVGLFIYWRIFRNR